MQDDFRDFFNVPKFSLDGFLLYNLYPSSCVANHAKSTANLA
jgi:hypothetical protein